MYLSLRHSLALISRLAVIVQLRRTKRWWTTSCRSQVTSRTGLTSAHCFHSLREHDLIDRRWPSDRLIEYSHLPFCSDTAIPKGAGPSDTLCKMLATVKGVTPAMTLAVLKEFGTYRRLMDAYDRAGTDAEADMLLANLIVRYSITRIGSR